ncbi:MAG: alpha/beta hydrolase [Thermomicrobiales bacterium]|nr:alpha/beta hydrolase [Thermomicrobiales bacterium]
MSDPLPRVPGGPGVSRFVQRGEHRLSYESRGAPGAPPVLVLHDLLAARGQLRDLADALTNAGWEAVLADVRGHGASPLISGPGYPPAELAADAIVVLDAEGLPAARVVAFGWSALIALALAARFPDRVTGVVLVEPYLPALLAGHPNEEARKYGAAHLEAVAQAADAAYKGQTDRALDLYPGVRWGTGWRDHIPKARLGAIRRAAPSLGALLTTLGQSAADETLAAVHTPVTMLVRRNSRNAEQWNAEALALRIPGAGVLNVEIEPGIPPAETWTAAIVKSLGRPGK